ncbi:hypothetical protein JV173_02140 [Acholeplasma equirhinis]|uniref:carboxylesterase family protein n=1 Tax=Acholeplasma equirhinis TaxID=555393 RepID=UPI00197AFEF6|nr:alpha/beta hydrolase-fold protein [Acholeplasma equirhinis]MBN3490306.1 hypothetical protein [Acholeplasma equirhinis]
MNLVDIMKLESYDNPAIGQKLQYTVYIPQEKRDKYKLFIFMHGSGERGEDGLKPIMYHAKIAKMIIEHPVYGKETIIIAPQVPTEQRWMPLEDVFKGTYRYATNQPTPIQLIFNDFLENELFKRYPIDKHHVYMGGISMGGSGIMDYITRYPDMFAAVIPICGTLDITQLETYKKTPMWLFHSSDDTTVSYVPFRDGAKVLMEMGAPVRYTEYNDTGHPSWHRAYETEGLLDWLFSHSK